MKRTSCQVLLCVVCISVALIQACGGGSGSSGGGGNNNPVPSVSSIAPASAPQFGSALTLTVTGSGFIHSSTVQWKGNALSTSYQSAGSLTAQVPAANLSTIGSFEVTVVNPAPGGGSSAAVNFAVGNPVPVLASISPSSASAGSAALTLTATGSNFVSGAAIGWNGTALTTTFVSATKLTAQVPAPDLAGSGSSASTATVTVVNPTPNGGASAGAQFAILPTAITRLVTINVQANDIAWDSAHGTMYASLPSTFTNGNSVVAIDPVTATVGTPVAVGSEPRPLALSDDNSFLYVGIDGSGQVKRLSLPAFTIDSSLALQMPNDPLYGQQVAITLAVAPGAPHTFAAILGNYSWTPANTGGTAVYDDATRRAGIVTAYNEDDSALVWGGDASTLYANNGTSSGNDLYVMSVNAGGLTLNADYGYLVPTQYGKLHYDAASKHLYVDGGRVVDPAAGNLIASFNVSPEAGYISSQCALDLQNGLVFFLGQTVDQFNSASGVQIEAFDAKTYNLRGTLWIPGVSGYPHSFVRWGKAGLAFIMSGTSSGNYLLQPPGGPIYLVDGAFVNAAGTTDFSSGTNLAVLPGLASISPQSATVGSANTTLTVTGSSFSSTAAVTWNGTALQTTVMSTTELQATIPAADLATAGTAVVSISDATSSVAADTSLAFTILPASGGTTNLSALNLAGLDVAWDAKDARLIVPLWSADPQFPNTILAVDPNDGSITQSATVSSDPDLVRVTDDGSEIYIGFREVNSVASLSLPNLGAGSSFGLGADSFSGPYYAYDLEPAPGAPQTIALAFASNGFEPPETNGMTIFDNGIARTNGASKSIGFQNIQWTSADSKLYAVDNGFSLYTYGVDASGLTVDSQQRILNMNSTLSLGDIHFDAGTGYLYDDNGWVIDPANGSILADFKASGLAIPDSALNRVFILGQLAAQAGTSNYTIQSFDQTNFGLVHSLSLNALIGTPMAFVRWGSNGLALVTYNQKADSTEGPAGMLYILSDSNFVSANARQGSGPQAERVHSFPRIQRRDVSIAGARDTMEDSQKP